LAWDSPDRTVLSVHRRTHTYWYLDSDVKYWSILAYSDQFFRRIVPLLTAKLVSSCISGHHYSHKNDKVWSGRPDERCIRCDVCPDLPYSITYSDEIIKAGKASVQCNH
jgi:hypothetical protein